MGYYTQLKIWAFLIVWFNLYGKPKYKLMIFMFAERLKSVLLVAYY